MSLRKALLTSLTIIVVALGASRVDAQREQIDEARVLMQSGDHDRAIELLKAYTTDNPDDGEGWTTLANAYHVKGDYENALETNRFALKFPGYNLTAKYNEACALSLLGRVDEANKALREAIDMGFVDYDHMEADPDLDPIREKFKLTGPPHHTYESREASNGVVLSYKLLVPKDFDEDKIYPAVVFFPPGPGPRTADWAMDEFVGINDDTKGWIIVYMVAPEIGWYTHPSHDAFEELLMALHEDYGIEGKFHMAGFGTGSRVATTYALMSRPHVQSLTTFSGWHWRGFEDEELEPVFEDLAVRLVVGANDAFGLPLNENMEKQLADAGLDVKLTVVKKDNQMLSRVRGAKILGYFPRIE